MLGKLAFRNAKRSVRDYVVYLITVTLAFSLIFSFNLIVFSPDIMELSSAMSAIRPVIITVSVIVTFIIGWLVFYTMRFMLQKRSKEFGTYMVLGIDKKKMIKMFLTENVLLGLISLILSFFVGFVLSQVMTFIIMNIFNLPYQVNFTISINAVLLTLLSFVLIYLFALFKSRRIVKKMRLHELLYYDRANERKVYKSKKNRNIIFALSFAAGVLSIVIFTMAVNNVVNNDSGSPMMMMLTSLILLIFSIYGVSITFADFLTTIVLKNNKIKYRGNNLFVTRQFTAKLKTMGFTIGTLTLLIALTFISLNVSNMFYGMFKTQTESTAPYDIMVYNLYSDTEKAVGKDQVSRLDTYLDFIKREYTIVDKLTYNVYTNRTDLLRRHISDGRVGYQPFDCFLRVSDYNKLLKLRKMKQIKLTDDEYYIHSFRDVSGELKKYLKTNYTLTVANAKLKNKGLTDYRYTTSWSRGSSYIIIVPDKVIDDGNFEVVNQITAIDTAEETTEQFAHKLDKLIPPKVYYEDQNEYHTVISVQQNTVKGAVLNENRSMITIISFSLMYLAFIFIAVVGNILSIQSLSDSAKYKYRYQILSKLGMNEREINKTLGKQLILFFGFPVCYPIIISFASAFSLAIMFNPFMASDYSILFYVLLNFGLFMFVYLVYFIATYFGFKKNVSE